MRPWRFATDNIQIATWREMIVISFNEAVAFCHG